MNLFSSILSAGAILAAGAATASAQSVTYQASFDPMAIPFASSPLVSLPQFNPALGVLNWFSLELVATTDAGQITYTDTSGNVSTDVKVLGVDATVTATAPGAVTLIAVPMQTGSDSSLPAFGSYTVSGGSGTESDAYGPDSNPAHFAPYEGGGNFTVDVGAVLAQALVTSGGSGTLTPADAETSGTISVTYNYDAAVSEPSTLALLLVGGCALPLLRRQRQHKLRPAPIRSTDDANATRASQAREIN